MDSLEPMNSLEISGRTLEEAIEAALKELDVARDEVEIVVLSKGKSGILGIGSESARVRVTRLAPEVQYLSLAKEILDKLFKTMAVTASSRIERANESVADSEPYINIEGEDSGLLIGRRGETLATLQFLVNILLSSKTKSRVMARLDVEGYLQHRYEGLRTLAMQMAEKAVTTGRSVSLEPMPARERRIIHVALSDHPKVATASIGEGEGRKVVISLRQGPKPPHNT